MKKIIPFALVLAMLVPACGGYTVRDAVLEAGFATATVLDERQTEKSVAMCQEGNALIGKCGDGPVSMTMYFPGVVITHVILSAVIPAGYWRTLFQGLTLGVEAKTVHRNYIEGIKP